MAIELKKKTPIDLTKKTPGLRNVVAGLGWDANAAGGEVDCDVSVFMLDSRNKIPGEGYFVFFNNLTSEDGAVTHTGDNRTGAGDGDDEAVLVDLGKVHSNVAQILFAVTIHEAEERKQHFGVVTNAFIRLYNGANSAELCKFTLADRFADMDSLIIARLYRDGNEWKFEAMGDAFAGGLAALVELYN